MKEMHVEDSILNELINKSILTGSRAYGIESENSDYDYVIEECDFLPKGSYLLNYKFNFVSLEKEGVDKWADSHKDDFMQIEEPLVEWLTGTGKYLKDHPQEAIPKIEEMAGKENASLVQEEISKKTTHVERAVPPLKGRIVHGTTLDGQLGSNTGDHFVDPLRDRLIHDHLHARQHRECLSDIFLDLSLAATGFTVDHGNRVGFVGPCRIGWRFTAS